MIFNLKNSLKLIKKNIEFSLFFLLLITLVVSTNFYNNYSKSIDENYRSVINNIYFQKTINHIFDDLTPRYKNINHKISNGETFDKILNSYSIKNDEIIKIKKELNLDYNLNNLKTKLDIKFTIDQSDNKKIISFIFPVSRTKKIQLTKNLETNLLSKQ